MAEAERGPDGRPDPDALLAAYRKAGGGKLKVFLGAAPGVGKTYAMLQGARRLRKDGVDVVIGLVETHNRAETAALVEGLEILPRREIDYRGRTLREFDLDAALARKPALIVVDEFAHTNAPDSRHPKRWQDVQELLAAGIGVWTALNIQHLESLADAVSRITGVAVRETVPDTMLQEAADVVLVDITPDELIERLGEGKVYLPETARRARQNFFTPGNLTALRELALRRTADRVDDEIDSLLGRDAPEGPWGAAERLLACLGPDAASERIARRAAQLATALNGKWIAATVDRPDRAASPSSEAEMARTLRLVEELGGTAMRLQGADFPGEILRLARREGATQIVLGQSKAAFWRRLVGRSLSEEIIRRAGAIEVHVIPHDAPDRAALFTPARWLRREGFVVDLGAAVASVAVAVLLGDGLSALLRLPNLSMIFLAAVLFCGAFRGTRAAVLASLGSFLAYNFFFIEPIYTFTIAQPQELFALLIFLGVSVLTGSLAGRIRAQRDSVMKNAAMTQSLYDYSRKLSGASSADEILWAATAHLHATFGGNVVMLATDGDHFGLRAAWPPDAELDAATLSAARWAREKREPAGRGTGTLPSIAYEFRPLIASVGVIAVCGFARGASVEPARPEEERALTTILDQTALALDRAEMSRNAVKTVAMEENEKVREALLASLSHDLRTPISIIAGAVGSLKVYGDKINPEQKIDLLTSIEEETERLSRFVANLLDMSRIEAGGLKVNRELVDVAETVQRAAERSRKSFPAMTVQSNVAPTLPFIRGDERLLEQVLFNLLDNANKYGGDGGARIHARQEGGHVVISVTDEGPGVKAADLERVFEKFYRGGRTDGRKPGTGLGLSICKGLVEAMGGTIQAQSPAVRRRGTRIVIRLPIADNLPSGLSRKTA